MYTKKETGVWFFFKNKTKKSNKNSFKLQKKYRPTLNFTFLHSPVQLFELYRALTCFYISLASKQIETINKNRLISPPCETVWEWELITEKVAVTGDDKSWPYYFLSIMCVTNNTKSGKAWIVCNSWTWTKK